MIENRIAQRPLIYRIGQNFLFSLQYSSPNLLKSLLRMEPQTSIVQHRSNFACAVKSFSADGKQFLKKCPMYSRHQTDLFKIPNEKVSENSPWQLQNRYSVVPCIVLVFEHTESEDSLKSVDSFASVYIYNAQTKDLLVNL